jgi:hypothetical protein
MAQIPVSQMELKNAFKKHYHVYSTIDSSYNPITRRLLLFYAVESGLKCYLLKRIHKNTTNELYAYYKSVGLRGHDIRRLVKLVGIMGKDAYHLKRFVMADGNLVEPEQFHQVWRYGIKTESAKNEAQAESILKNIAVWLTNNLD